MIVYKLRSGDRWYGPTGSDFRADEEKSPIFLNMKRIEKLIREERKIGEYRAREWGNTSDRTNQNGWWITAAEDWAAVEVVEYKLVEVKVTKL